MARTGHQQGGGSIDQEAPAKAEGTAGQKQFAAEETLVGQDKIQQAGGGETDVVGVAKETVVGTLDPEKGIDPEIGLTREIGTHEETERGIGAEGETAGGPVAEEIAGLGRGGEFVAVAHFEDLPVGQSADGPGPEGGQGDRVGRLQVLRPTAMGWTQDTVPGIVLPPGTPVTSFPTCVIAASES